MQNTREQPQFNRRYSSPGALRDDHPAQKHPELGQLQLNTSHQPHVRQPQHHAVHTNLAQFTPGCYGQYTSPSTSHFPALASSQPGTGMKRSISSRASSDFPCYHQHNFVFGDVRQSAPIEPASATTKYGPRNGYPNDAHSLSVNSHIAFGQTPSAYPVPDEGSYTATQQPNSAIVDVSDSLQSPAIAMVSGSPDFGNYVACTMPRNGQPLSLNTRLDTAAARETSDDVLVRTSSLADPY